MTSLVELSEAWIAAKDAEREAIERRRSIEDRLAAFIGIDESLDGTSTTKIGGLEIKVTGRLDRKVDADLLVELAAEAGLQDHLSALFRWKPEINKRAWDNAADSITRPLLGAITTKPGRPSFVITKKED